MEQTVLVLKQNKDFQTLSTKDQTELLESNAMVVSLLTNIELYQVPSKTIAWSLTETDYQALRKQAVEAQNGRAVFGLSDVNLRVEADLRDDIGKLFKFFEYFYLIGVPKSALLILALVAVFCHDCCDIENKDRVETLRRRNLIILYECISQTQGILGTCKIGLKTTRPEGASRAARRQPKIQGLIHSDKVKHMMRAARKDDPGRIRTCKIGLRRRAPRGSQRAAKRSNALSIRPQVQTHDESCKKEKMTLAGFESARLVSGRRAQKAHQLVNDAVRRVVGACRRV